MKDDDRRLLILGVLGLVGSFFTTKAIIDGVIKERAERDFIGPRERRRQTIVDDAFRFLGVTLGVYTMVEQAPGWIDEANKLLGGE